jgi:hypothetical protein
VTFGYDIRPSIHLGLSFCAELSDVVEFTYLSIGILFNSFVLSRPGSDAAWELGLIGAIDEDSKLEKREEGKEASQVPMDGERPYIAHPRAFLLCSLLVPRTSLVRCLCDES